MRQYDRIPRLRFWSTRLERCASVTFPTEQRAPKFCVCYVGVVSALSGSAAPESPLEIVHESSGLGLAIRSGHEHKAIKDRLFLNVVNVQLRFALS